MTAEVASGFPGFFRLNFACRIFRRFVSSMRISKNLKYVLSSYSIVFVLVLIGSPGQAERSFPKPSGLINDFANVIPAWYRLKLTQVCSELFEKTSVPIVLVSMPDIGGADYNDYAVRLYNTWGIGQKGINKGVLIFVTVKERKVRIVTGTGMDDIRPNNLCAEILKRNMMPYFREDRFGEGLLKGTIAFA